MIKHFQPKVFSGFCSDGVEQSPCERGGRGGLSLGRARAGLPRQEDQPREFPSWGWDPSSAHIVILVLGRIAELKSMGLRAEIRE